MFGDIRRALTTYKVEAVSSAFVWQGKLVTIGSVANFVNDRSRPFVQLQEASIAPLHTDRQMRAVRREELVFARSACAFISLTDPEQARSVQILQSQRPVVFYMQHFVVQGQLHVNEDSKDTDLIDDTRDYYVVTDASVFPIRPIAVQLERHVPLLFVNIHHILAYHRFTD